MLTSSFCWDDSSHRKGVKQIKINIKQQELIDSLLKALKKNFPDVKFVDITESPENSNDLWVNLTDQKIKDLV
ncbi:MAG: hypothetical protein BWK80_34210 [Desulfobacteraceae bacterium IS3]|nr:MAG: hypothetical protein BWK80_34210 [Desulfobacteraceae bacterium IS3]